MAEDIPFLRIDNERELPRWLRWITEMDCLQCLGPRNSGRRPVTPVNVGLETYEFTSCDGQTIQFPEPIVDRITLLHRMREDMGNIAGVATIAAATGANMQFMIDYLMQHKDEPNIEASDMEARRARELKPEDWVLLDVSIAKLLEYMALANYFQCDFFLDCCAKMLAERLKDKSAMEIRQIFGLQNDLEDEEVREVRLKSDWCLRPTDHYDASA
ncbi:unnamed protein product [Caenorhabditis auriculariae]|uniref:SKP1 component dimerisation domain-containing protein n=1 Tax=Caenorhabditis auriculariae TaxID=2777116 RepID=A0A8S1HBZ4_9PELO|nr:unnamed protein product [Caenorhabditis auriculariae]